MKIDLVFCNKHTGDIEAIQRIDGWTMNEIEKLVSIQVNFMDREVLEIRRREDKENGTHSDILTGRQQIKTLSSL